jgi:hypothetical protein
MTTPATLAADLPFNPVPCGVSPCGNPALYVLEAVVSERISDNGRLWWLTCGSIICLCDAQQQADSYLPLDSDLRDATVAELEHLSGIAVLAGVA